MYEKLKQLLDEHHIPEERFLNDLEITKNCLRNWKECRNKPKKAKLKEIADYFGVDVSYFDTTPDRVKLKDHLETLPDDRIIYVGSNAAFVAVGLKSELIQSLLEFDESESARIAVKREGIEKMYKGALKKWGADNEETVKFKEELARTEYVPFLERGVIDTWERFSEDAINVQVEGSETGKIWSIHEADKFSVEYNEEKLAGAVIKGVVTDYKFALRVELDEFKQTLKEIDKALKRLEKYRTKSEEFEEWLQSDDCKTYTAIDPAYLISLTRQIIAEQLAEEEVNNRKKRKKKGEKDANTEVS